MPSINPYNPNPKWTINNGFAIQGQGGNILEQNLPIKQELQLFSLEGHESAITVPIYDETGYIGDKIITSEEVEAYADTNMAQQVTEIKRLMSTHIENLSMQKQFGATNSTISKIAIANIGSDYLIPETTGTPPTTYLESLNLPGLISNNSNMNLQKNIMAQYNKIPIAVLGYINTSSKNET